MNENEYKLEIYVTKDNVTIKNKEKIHTGEYKITKCEFEFTEDYEGLTKKAIFEAEDVIKEMPIISNECDIPEEVLRDGYLQCNLRVYGYDIEEVDGEMTVRLRYSPTYDTFPIWKGSFIPNAEQGEEITPTQFEQYTAALNEGLEAIEDKIEEADAILENIDTAIEETNNLDLDVSKEDKVATVTLTKKDATTKVVTLSDGTSLMFNWDGTKLGIKTDEDAEYTYVDLQGVQGPIGPQGEAFQIKKTYSSVAEMNADFDNMQLGDYVMIASSVQIEDNAKLYTRGQEAWIFISDFSGAQGIKGETGATPNIQIGTVTSGNAPSVTRTGTNENPILNFVLEKGEKGDTGDTGATGETGNGIESIEKTGTSGLVDTYTITFTDGTTTTFDITNGEDGEVTQAQLDATNRMVEQARLVYNALPKVTGSGEEITLNNTAETPLGITLKGNTYQETTTGKNLLPNLIKTGRTSSGVTFTYNEDGTYTLNGQNDDTANSSVYLIQNGSFTLPAGTYYTISPTGGVALIGYGNSRYTTFFSKTVSSFTLDVETTFTSVYLQVAKGQTINFNNYVVYPIISTNAITETDYEPYTNGASPNPDYPQEVQVVTGDNTIKVEGKNLFDKDNATTINISIQANNLATSSSSNARTTYMKIQPNKTYTISKTASQRFIVATSKVTPASNISLLQAITNNTGTNITITTDSEARYLLIYFFLNGTDTKTQEEIYDTIQVEYGQIASTYAPYASQTYPINLGKNLLPFTNQDFTKNSFRFYVQNGELYFNGTPSSDIASANSAFKDNFAFTLPKGTYYFNRGNVLTNVVATISRIFKYSDDTILKENLGAFTLTEDTKVYLGFYLPTSKTFSNNKIDIQLEKGDQPTSYAPYFTPIELCKIGDYQDYIYKSGDNWYKKRYIFKATFDGTENWSLVNANAGQFRVTLNSCTNNPIYSNYFKYKLTYQTTDKPYLRPGASQLYAEIGTEMLPEVSVSAWTTWLSEHNTEVYYILATPTDIQITNAELIEQLNNLYYAYAYKEQTNINQENSSLASLMSAETTRDLSDIFTNE